MRLRHLVLRTDVQHKKYVSKWHQEVRGRNVFSSSRLRLRVKILMRLWRLLFKFFLKCTTMLNKDRFWKNVPVTNCSIHIDQCCGDASFLCGSGKNFYAAPTLLYSKAKVYMLKLSWKMDYVRFILLKICSEWVVNWGNIAPYPGSGSATLPNMFFICFFMTLSL
jgi:hypothetical protein